MKISVFHLFVLAAGLSACGGPSKSDDIVISNEINLEHKEINIERTRKENNAHGGKFYSSIDSVNQFTAGYVYVLADSLKDRNVTVYVSGWLREPEAPLDGSIVVSLTTSKGTVGWTTLDNRKVAFKPGEWVQIRDSVIFESAKLKDPYAEIGVVGIKTKGRDMLDIDDIQIRYKFSK